MDCAIRACVSARILSDVAPDTHVKVGTLVVVVGTVTVKTVGVDVIDVVGVDAVTMVDSTDVSTSVK